MLLSASFVMLKRLPSHTPRMVPTNTADLQHYFEYSSKGIDVLSDGLQEIQFGEFLVALNLVDRYQLFRALQMQDRHPGVRIGECVAALGYLQIGEIEKQYSRFAELQTVTV
jgi:hypothetical protein